MQDLFIENDIVLVAKVLGAFICISQETVPVKQVQRILGRID